MEVWLLFEQVGALLLFLDEQLLGRRRLRLVLVVTYVISLASVLRRQVGYHWLLVFYRQHSRLFSLLPGDLHFQTFGLVWLLCLQMANQRIIGRALVLRGVIVAPQKCIRLLFGQIASQQGLSTLVFEGRGVANIELALVLLTVLQLLEHIGSVVRTEGVPWDDPALLAARLSGVAELNLMQVLLVTSQQVLNARVGRVVRCRQVRIHNHFVLAVLDWILINCWLLRIVWSLIVL